MFIASFPHIGSLTVRKRYFLSGDLEPYPVSKNHISVFTPAIFKTTVLRYFTLTRTTYWTDIEKIRRGRLGIIKAVGLTRGWSRFEEWFAHEVMYVLTRR